MTRRTSTEGKPPPQLLVESDDPYGAMVDVLPFVDAGFDVVVCGGPATGEPCPALDGQPCPLVTDADLVLNAVSDTERQTAIASAVRATTPDVPVVVRVRPDVDADMPPGCLRLSASQGMSAQVSAIGRALSGQAETNPYRDGGETPGPSGSALLP